MKMTPTKWTIGGGLAIVVSAIAVWQGFGFPPLFAMHHEMREADQGIELRSKERDLELAGDVRSFQLQGLDNAIQTQDLTIQQLLLMKKLLGDDADLSASIRAAQETKKRLEEELRKGL